MSRIGERLRSYGSTSGSSAARPRQPQVVPQVVSAFVRHKFQDADAGDSRSARLPAGCVGGIPALHDASAGGRAVENVLFPRRRSLGAKAAEFPALVQERKWLGVSVGV